MLKITWVIVALHNVGGFEFTQYLNEHQYKTAGVCVTESLRLPTEDTITGYQCAQLYNGQKYVSQPSWMSNEQADAMVEKQQLIKGNLTK